PLFHSSYLHPPSSTPFPYTTLFRSEPTLELGAQAVEPPIDVPFPECAERREPGGDGQRVPRERAGLVDGAEWRDSAHEVAAPPVDRKSTRLNSSHVSISYAVFCLKK